MSVPAKKAKWLASSRTHSETVPKEKKGLKWTLGIVLGLFILLMIVLMEYWSIEPDHFSVVDKSLERAKIENPAKLASGYIYTNTLVEIVDTLVYKRGGYLSNDIAPPSVLMDNMKNWEFGALVMLRDAATALRNHFARHQSQSKENADLSKAEPNFYFENDSWMVPSTEGEYKKGARHLVRYLDGLQHETDASAHFYARADNLSQYLQIVEKRLGSLSHRLSASSMQKHQYNINADRSVVTITPWMEIDDVFFEARGSMWALLHIFRAIEIEFADILRGKAATATLRQIIHELEDSQGSLLSPVVLNGNGFGIFASYSLTMANLVTRANAAALDLKDLMIRG